MLGAIRPPAAIIPRRKWQAMGLVPALDPDYPHDFFLFVADDKDFFTPHDFHAGASYRDPSGVEVVTMFLVFRVTLAPVCIAE